MEIKFNVTGAKRKELVTAIGEILKVKPKYLGMPSVAYEVDYLKVDKVGTVSFDDRADSEEVENLLGCLAERGLAPEGNDTLVENKENTDETLGLTIEMPRDGFDESSLANLENLISSKSRLIKKALGINSLEIEITDEKVIFPWFNLITPDSESVKAYTTFAYLLSEMAKKQKRINAKEKGTDNEKYTFRCFLLRLGFIGEGYKAERKILLQNFSGSSSFKGKKYKVELDDDNFKIFTAPNERSANEIAWQIANELGSEFCEIKEVE